MSEVIVVVTDVTASMCLSGPLKRSVMMSGGEMLFHLSVVLLMSEQDERGDRCLRMIGNANNEIRRTSGDHSHADTVRHRQ
jgi:hypothetical protein